MARLDDDVISELENHWRRLLVDDFLEILERHHHDADRPGVPRDLVEEYFDSLEARDEFDVGPMREQFEENLSAEQSFVDENAVYEVGDGRVSASPAEWHEAVDEDGSLADLVGAMTASTDDTAGSAAAKGVPEDGLLDTASAIRGTTRDEERGRLKNLASEGVLVMEADQHPRSGVSLPEDADIQKEDISKPDWGDRSSE